MVIEIFIILFQYVLHVTWLACLSCVMYMVEEHFITVIFKISLEPHNCVLTVDVCK